jgi:hypothetical protein
MSPSQIRPLTQIKKRSGQNLNNSVPDIQNDDYAFELEKPKQGLILNLENT